MILDRTRPFKARALRKFCYYWRMPREYEQRTGRAFRHRFESPFWREFMVWGIRTIPPTLQLATMPMWAGIFYALVPEARRTVEQNLRQALGPANPITEHARSYRLFVNYAQSLANMYALYLGQDLPIEPTFVGREKLEAARDRGKGLIMVTGHLGYWALGPFLLERSGFGAPVMAMAQEANAAAQQFEEQFRKRFRIVYTSSSPFASLELATLLRNRESVAMHIDRPTGGPTVEIELFGRRAAFPLGPATLARATRAPIVPVFMVREGLRGFCSRVEDPIEVARTSDRERDLREATEKMVRVYERYVRRYPEQWFNFHDLWAPPPVAPPAAVEPARLDPTGTTG